MDLEDVVAPPAQVAESPLQDWRLKYQAGTIQITDLIAFIEKESGKYFALQYASKKVRWKYNQAGAKEGIIDVIFAFILGDNPKTVLEKLQQEATTTAVCGKVFKNGEPTYSCRECGMDPTCFLCVSCFQQSAHRYHKYEMSTSGGRGCCDCGDEEAWKKDHYCEEHLRGKENPTSSTIITEAIKKRCEVAFVAILTFCVIYLEIETNANLKYIDSDGSDDTNYCTLLYNDESHTFDQVVQVLTIIGKYYRKDANEIGMDLDREGRVVVKFDSLHECRNLKENIEKQSAMMNAQLAPSRANQSLRVSVLHVNEVSCQLFALQLLKYLREFLILHCTFREIFTRIIMDKKTKYCIKHILEYDVKLWKTARKLWHRLLMSGILMEYDNKMALAQEFSKHYSTVVQDFIHDDHEHSLAIVSLSVQLFTVPSIAHYLIAYDNIFHKLLHTFYHEAIEKYIKRKTLHFAKNMANMLVFKRAAYILYDLRYILSFKPHVWTDDLREGFLDGCKTLIRLLFVMQGMQLVTRQTGQNVSFMQEWECAFSLHIKLASTISLVLAWCASDSVVLGKMYQTIISALSTNGYIVQFSKTEEKTVAGYVANCIMYDVATQPVSIHLPLSRFFAGIYLHFGAHGFKFDNELSLKRSPENIMEPILCTQTMIAQIHSGMWRLNGHSMLYQLYFYRNVRCRSEMLDRDIVGMQICAALIESNQYLIRILNKFNLINWVQPYYERYLETIPTNDDFIRQLSMIEEFLELLIVIIGERFMPGVSKVTEEDRTKNEIIQLLCIKSYSHSELKRALPDSNNDTSLDDVIDSVAEFKKPHKSNAKGVYELKEELYDNYNMYFYHYTKEEKSKSEETQRLRRKNRNELVCCPPPKLPKLTDGFISIANLLQCDVMMTIISTVLDRALDLKAKSFIENHLQEVLYLIGYGLQEEESENYPFLSFYERSQKYKLLYKLEQLSRSARVEAHRDFLLWTVKKFKELQAKEAAKIGSDAMQSDDAESSTTGLADAATAASVGGDDVIEPPPLTATEQEKQDKEERARLAAERRAKIMAQMQSAQKSFMKSNAEMFASTNAVAQSNDTTAAATSNSSSSTTMEWQAEDTPVSEEGAVAYNSVACLGVGRRLQQPEEQSCKCILCFEDCTVSKNGPTLVYSAFIQKSKVLPSASKYNSSVHTSSCGHVMHVNCWQEYYNNEESKEQRRPHRNRAPFLPATQSTDFQCPYCRCLSNTVLPLTAPLSKYSMPIVIQAGDEVFPIDLWIEVMKTFGDDLNKLRTEEDADMWYYGMPAWDTILNNSNLIVDTSQFERIAQPINKLELPASWTNFVQHYVKSARQYAPNDFELNEHEGLLWLWHSCIYTVASLEVYLRAVDKPFKTEMSIRHKSCLSGLVRASCLYASTLSQNDVKNLVPPVAELLDTVFKQKGTSVVQWDCFSMMASAIFMVPNMLFAITPNKTVVANGSMMDFYTMQLFFLANMVKVIVMFIIPEAEAGAAAAADTSMDIDEECEQEVKNMPQKVQDNISEFYRKYNLPARAAAFREKQARRTAQATSATTTGAADKDTAEQRMTVVDADEEEVNNDDEQSANEPPHIVCNAQTIVALFKHIKKDMSQFLRSCCLFFHFVTDVEFPEEFTATGSDTFEHMCKYLGLQANLEAYFNSESTYATILETFASHPDIEYFDFATNKKRNGEDLQVVFGTLPVPSLVKLPEDYSDLINAASAVICPNNLREEMKTPTMCLICGHLLCGQSYCCQPELDSRTVGACTYHAYFCGAEIGIFLRIRDCQIVYLGRNKGCFVQPPYLDEYGETDQGLRRGNPLRLCPARYSKIHLTWLGHGLHEEIARLNDNTSVAVTQWHHM